MLTASLQDTSEPLRTEPETLNQLSISASRRECAACVQTLPMCPQMARAAGREADRAHALAKECIPSIIPGPGWEVGVSMTVDR